MWRRDAWIERFRESAGYWDAKIDRANRGGAIDFLAGDVDAPSRGDDGPSGGLDTFIRV